jgi:Transposase DDE domain
MIRLTNEQWERIRKHFPEERPAADSDPSCARSGAVDSQHRCAMAYAAAKLSELQNCASTLTIMAIVDRHGLPLSVSTHAANHHEVRLVQLCFDFYMIEAKPENLIGDRAYDSDPLDDELRNDGIEMIAPHRSNRSKPPTQNRRRLSRYMRRWMKPDSCLWSLHQGIDRQGGIFLRASTTILGVMRRSAAVGSGAYSGSTGGFFGRPACRQRQFCAGK